VDETRRLQYLAAMGIDVWLPSAGRLSAAAPAVAGPAGAEKRFEDREEDDGAALFESQLSEGKQGQAESDVFVLEDHETRSANPVAGMDWETLEKTVAQCRKCGLCATRTQTVFGSGNRQAQWMLIGEAPGQQEDLQGQPFVGKAGQLLTEMLRAMGLARDEVFIANVLKCRPPNNRDPKPDEMAACNTYILRQIELVQPKIILAVGRVAAQHLLQTDAPVGKLRGRVHYLGDIPLLVIYHPAYLLRSLLEKRKAWDDLQMALRVFHEYRR
jgi:uracil-DNA glycosylase family 4